jgi:hypothetical protein
MAPLATGLDCDMTVAGARIGVHEVTAPLGAGGPASARAWSARELRRGRAETPETRT